VPNGNDKNWLRVCGAIDRFREQHGRWPERVRLMPIAFVDLVNHVLTPIGFALVSSIVEIVSDELADVIADDESSVHGQDLPVTSDLSAYEWFGQAILRPHVEDEFP
jgi:hypothetical protein